MPNTIKVLFLCTGNSCRSQMAEGFTRSLRGDVLDAGSAGYEARGLDPHAIAVMREVGIDISRQRSKTLEDLGNTKYQYVVTVCSEADERCPVYRGEAKMIHHGFDDPSTLCRHARTEEERLDYYRRVRDEIRAYVLTLSESLTADHREILGR
ncbi:MAG: arsenate reductase ArsC [Deltaproteobacteria bacterium]|nr:arsenate reductase ArsC [Deltaproteobacteria bacterium]